MITALARLKVERHNVPAAAALLGMIALALLGQEAFKGGQQKRAEFAALRVGRLQVILLQKLRKESLRCVLGILDIS